MSKAEDWFEPKADEPKQTRPKQTRPKGLRDALGIGGGDAAKETEGTGDGHQA